ncbi:hypothetical protein H072_4104 [Dactylellina haptotyla CBS 200.50]|uniref:Uncharacterized protein n=1 Tax=Dactylellina haptotyla (strain CBS 200.50) TaxID=1284197 RepID=S8ALH2_DACHA|nr:hypothetical protein H072_4104 [Dactylellina haptotyla CBS 200.50]
MSNPVGKAKAFNCQSSTDLDTNLAYIQANTVSQSEERASFLLRREVAVFSTAVSGRRKRKRGALSIIEPDRPEYGGDKLDLADLAAVTSNSRIRTSLKNLLDTSQTDSPIKTAPTKLEAPIPDVVQAQIGRHEAYNTTKQTLQSWSDTVKSLRDAEQIIFPLPNPNSSVSKAALAITQKYKPSAQPQSSLESKISKALSLAALVQEPSLMKPSSVTSQKVSTIDARTKTAYLRMERELLLRKEAKAKRIKRIKSKSYRRILKKDARKATRQEDVDAADLVSDEEGNPQQRKEGYISENSGMDFSSNYSLPDMKFMQQAEKRKLLKASFTESATVHNMLSGRRLFHDAMGPRAPLDDAIAEKSDKNINATLLVEEISSPFSEPDNSIRNINPWLRLDTQNIRQVTQVGELELTQQQPPKPVPSQSKLHTGHIAFNNATGPVNKSLLSVPTGSQSNLSEKPALLARAFAGDNVLREMNSGPQSQVPYEHPKEPGNIPGWGDWSNTKNHMPQPNKKKKPILTLPKGDSKIEKVVFNHKISKKGSKYLATGLPYPFETNEQYERSLRFPIGQEWAPKQAHQELVAPKTVIRTGRAIAPLSRTD